MTTTSTANDVFAVAMRMEQIGKDFYQTLALACDHAKVRAFCLQAAQDETQHYAAFEQMHRQWSAPGAAGELSAETVGSLAALAKQQIQPDPEAVRRTALGGRLPDALGMAIQMEQDSIRFYEGLLPQLPGSAAALNSILAEEKRHLSSLRLLAA